MHRSTLASLVFGLAISASPARAQSPVSAPTAITRSAPANSRPAPVARPFTEADLRVWSQHAGWGAAVGGIIGVGYGAAVERGPLTIVMIVVDGVVGSAVGLVGGSVVYIVRRARGRV